MDNIELETPEGSLIIEKNGSDLHIIMITGHMGEHKEVLPVSTSDFDQFVKKLAKFKY